MEALSRHRREAARWLVDQDLAGWRDTVLASADTVGVPASVRVWLDRLPAAWHTDPRELVRESRRSDATRRPIHGRAVDIFYAETD